MIRRSISRVGETFPRALAPIKQLPVFSYVLRKATPEKVSGNNVRVFGRAYSSLLRPRLTAESYPSLSRDRRYKRLEAQDFDFFRSVLSEQGVLEAGEDENLAFYNEDWQRKYVGQSPLVLKPRTTQQVQQILEYCNKNRLAVVPQGGNTGLVGGSVPVFDEIVLSLSNLNRIISFDDVSGILKCEAGLILENADNFLAEKGYLFPIDLGAKGSCHVGGVVATNAGGLRLLRYGSLHGSVLGLEVVLPDGKVLSNIDSLRKDNTGYDWKQLFIGSEGTLGVVTKVSIMCPPRPTSVNVSFLGVNSYEAVQKLFVKAKRELGEVLSAFEFMEAGSQKLVSEQLKGFGRPLADEHNFYLLIETSGSVKEHDDAKLEAFLERAMEEELVSDGVIAQDETEAYNLWQWRERIPEACSAGGGTYRYDISLPLSEMYAIVEATNQRLDSHNLLSYDDPTKPVISAVGFGHIGDGNLHLNVAVREYSKEVESVLEPFIYEYIASKAGSISAEHGLGLQKKNYISYSRSSEEIELMKQLRDQFDHNRILNPYKYV